MINKINSLLLILLLVRISCLAQTDLTFDFDTLSVAGVSSEPDIVAYNSVKNNTSDSVEINWKRTINDFPNDWRGTAICDLNTCYFVSVDEPTQTVILRPNASSNIDAHFYPRGFSGNATVQIAVWVLGDSANTVVSTVFKAEVALDTTTGINDFIDPNISIGPNPLAGNYLRVQGLPANKNLTIEVSTILGRRLRSDEVQSGSSLYQMDLADLSQGIYLIQVFNKEQNLIHSSTLLRP